MKNLIVAIMLVSVLTILFAGCTTVGAVNLPVNLNNNEKQVEDIPTDKIEDIDDSTTKDEDETNLDKAVNEETKVDEDDSETNNIAEQFEYESITDSEQKLIPAESKIHYFGDGSKKLVALTFDDGPESTYTSQILDILDEYGIKGTFFVIGQSAEKYPEVLKDIHEKGHEIGNHSWNHKYFPKLSKAAMEKEIIMTENIIKEILGEYTLIFRPPYGALKKQGIDAISSLGYSIVNWSVDTKDWAGTSRDQMMKYVELQLKPGGIILMHNSGNQNSVKNTVELLPEMIEWIIEQGYEFVTVSEILDL